MHTDVDVLIVGAGLSGINAAYRVHERNPGASYTIFEGRDSLGGTWDLFRYPGVRSDSDFFTLAFPFNPWRGKEAIVTGEQIRDYLDATTRKYGIDGHIEYNTRVISVDWSSQDKRWTVTAERGGKQFETTARFVVACTGYYDYESPYDPGFAGIEDFTGEVAHPQFWPQDLDYSGKKVVVIGSGATAVTVVPAMAEKASSVTMLQRTPTYILAQPWTDPIGDVARKILPAKSAHYAIRAKNTGLQWGLYQVSQRRPKFVRSLIRKLAVHGVGGDSELVDEHFNPPYDPWDQRLCIAPGGDFYAAIKADKATVVTDQIRRFVEKGIELESGEVLEADIVVPATGLALKVFGGITASVDGRTADPANQVVWNGAMMDEVPNFAFCIGYVNLSWTMRSDMTSRLVAKVVERLLADPELVVTPQSGGIEAERPLFDMESGYLARGAHLMPRVTDSYPWTMKQNFMVDSWNTNRADLDDGLIWSTASVGAAANA